MSGTRIKVYSHTAEAIRNDCRLWAKKIAKDFAPDLVVFPAKSGFLFAEPIAKELNVPLVDVIATRPGNDMKDDIRKRVPWVPQWLLALALSSKAMYGYNEENSERNVSSTQKFDTIDWGNVERVLLIDDSVDTGWSILAVKGLLEEVAPASEVRIASYCVVDVSEKRVAVDWWRYRNAIVLTATSRYSPEHEQFLEDYKNWRQGADVCA